MNEYRFLVPLLIFLSPLLYILSGCQWKPDAPGNVIHVKTSDFLTPKVKPVSLPAKPKSPLCTCQDCECENCDCGTKPAPPTMAPVPDGQPNKYAPLKFPEVDRTPPKPLTAGQRAGLSNGEEFCTDGSCGVQGDGGGRRGLFGRWRR